MRITRSLRRRAPWRSGMPGVGCICAGHAGDVLDAARVVARLEHGLLGRDRGGVLLLAHPDRAVHPAVQELACTTGSSLVSSTSRGPNMTSSLRKSMPMLSGTVRARLMLWVTIRNVASICALTSRNNCEM